MAVIAFIGTIIFLLVMLSAGICGWNLVKKHHEERKAKTPNTHCGIGAYL